MKRCPLFEMSSVCRFGRQIGLLSAAVPQVLIGVIAAFSRQYTAFLVLYFFQGATQVGIMLSSFVWGELQTRKMILCGSIRLRTTGSTFNTVYILPLYVLDTPLVYMYLCLATELVGTSKRKIAALGHKMAYSIGAILLSFIAFLLRDWRAIEMAIAIPSVIFISYKW